MTPSDPPPIPVIPTQEDREAAGPFLRSGYRNSVELGVFDHNDLAQAFARHRIAAIEPLREALEEAATWFEEYAFQHGCKATQTADSDEQALRLDKAKVNKTRADYLRAALAKIGGAS